MCPAPRRSIVPIRRSVANWIKCICVFRADIVPVWHALIGETVASAAQPKAAILRKITATQQDGCGMRPGLPTLLATLASIVTAGWVVVSPANAQERIGLASAVRNDVSEIAPRATKINSGDDVVRDEVVRTSADSDAKIVFRDDTNLSIGPSATLKLDRVVFSGETTYKDIALRLTTGTFRFVTGHSDKQAYSIRTPLAVIGIRGTILDIQVLRLRNLVSFTMDTPGCARPAVASNCSTRATPQSSPPPALAQRSRGSAHRRGRLHRHALQTPRSAVKPHTPLSFRVRT